MEFLNSVIVDQQRKNELLQARLQVMESSSLSMSDSITDALVKYAPSVIHFSMPVSDLVVCALTCTCLNDRSTIVYMVTKLDDSL